MHMYMLDLVLKEVLLLSSQKQLQKGELTIIDRWEPYIAKNMKCIVDIRLAVNMFKYFFELM